MFVSAGSAFGFSLDILCWIFVACIIVFYLVFDVGATSENVGLALTQTLSMTGLLQWGRDCYEIEATGRFLNQIYKNFPILPD